MAAPIATTGLAVPFHHAFPLLAVGEYGPARIYGALLSLGNWLMQNRNDLAGPTFGTDWSGFFAWRFSSGGASTLAANHTR